MTKLLQEVFEKVSQLPEDEQESFAALMLHELESEQRWQELFAQSQDALAKMANQALAEHRTGKTKPLDPDSL
jgi:hypothetical protein